MIGTGPRQVARTQAGSPATTQLACLALAGLAVVIAQMALISLTRGLNHQTATSVSAVLPLLAGLMAPTVSLLALASRVAFLRPCQGAVLIVFAAGLAMRLAWLGVPAPLEDDFQRYLWDGAVVASGLDPYRYAPDQFLGAPAPHGYAAVAKAGEETLKRISFPDLRTIYPSSAQLAFAIAHFVAPFEIDGLRIVFLLAEVATFVLLLSLLSALKTSVLWSILYWWNPTVAFSLIGIAHVDALVPALVLGSLLAAIHRRTYASVALLGVAAGVKIWPVLLLPLVVARCGKHLGHLAASGALFVTALGFTIGPVMLSALRPNAGLTAYALTWGNNNAFFAWAVYLVSSATDASLAQPLLRSILAMGALATAVAAACRANDAPNQVAFGFLLVAATVFYLSPAQFPWYAVWFLPLAAVVRCWPLLAASATLPSYYLFYPFWAEGRGDTFFFGLAFLHSLPVLFWLTVHMRVRTPLDSRVVARRGKR